MKEEWITPYYKSSFEKKVQRELFKWSPKFIRIASYSSCSQNLKVGLEFAIKNQKPDHVPVLYAITCQNYQPILGIRLNNEAYTAYPSESEIVLEEGILVHVLSVERNVVIDNPHTSFQKFNGKILNIIHLFIPTVDFRHGH